MCFHVLQKEMNSNCMKVIEAGVSKSQKGEILGLNKKRHEAAQRRLAPHRNASMGGLVPSHPGCQHTT
jgi:hypothetical protein